MSDYHILSGDLCGNSYQVAFHIPVPDTTNQADVNYRTAIAEFQGGAAAITSAVSFIDAGELTQLQAGELYEVVRQFNSNPSETLGQKQSRLDTMFGAVQTEVQADFQDRLGFWGYSRDVP